WTLQMENFDQFSGFLNYTNTTTSRSAQISVMDNYGTNRIIGVAEWPGGGGPGGPQGGQQSSSGPTPTNQISFNHNPLFAFILLPIEIVQALYGTAFYGVLKLVLAIPLSVGLVGFLVGLIDPAWHKLARSKRSKGKYRR
ncbi:MAG: hypothetical protein AB1305_04665, partial [Candidatus Hadarchaeota archaeon]